MVVKVVVKQCKSKNINETVFVSSLVVALRSSAPEAVDVDTAFASTAAGVRCEAEEKTGADNFW